MNKITLRVPNLQHKLIRLSSTARCRYCPRWKLGKYHWSSSFSFWAKRSM